MMSMSLPPLSSRNPHVSFVIPPHSEYTSVQEDSITKKGQLEGDGDRAYELEHFCKYLLH
ncbi:hypothetical protein LguiA_031591 [Lonicera macranthoides]